MRVKAIDQSALAGNYQSEILDMTQCLPGFVAEFEWNGTLNADISVYSCVSGEVADLELIPGATANTGGVPGIQKISDLSNLYPFIQFRVENYAAGTGDITCVVNARDLK